MTNWYNNNVSSEWIPQRKEALEILQRESELQEIVQLIGYDALPEPEKGILDTARSIREDYLQQSAYDEVDTYTSIKKQNLMLSMILEFGRMEAEAIKKGVPSQKLVPLRYENFYQRLNGQRKKRLNI
jgi:V/A-type H+-transporting ATPase subunit A